jgi:isopentenyl diphosphate isomerase/L-lactate dehydrogenase-like FMN-dependent dehydrogenase
VLRDVAAVDTSTRLFGEVLAAPIVLGPVGMTRIAHAHGEIGAARAAERAGLPYVLSTMASTSPEDLASHVPGANRWFQLYMWRDREASRRLLDRAAAAGFSVLVLTADVPVAGARLRDARHGMTMPPSLTLRSLAQIATRPRWWFDAITRDPLAFAVVDNERGDFAERTNRILDPAVTFDDLDWLRKAWPGPLVVKGILDTQDAVTAVEHGADGVLLSNHGGRQLESAVAPLEVLQEVRAALPETPIIIDGGVRSGAHVAVALAAGADAVAIGRPYVYGLMAGGETGVDRAIEILRDGLERTMALMGATEIGALGTDNVRLR